jgi:hypothetical protein
LLFSFVVVKLFAWKTLMSCSVCCVGFLPLYFILRETIFSLGNFLCWHMGNYSWTLTFNMFYCVVIYSLFWVNCCLTGKLDVL